MSSTNRSSHGSWPVRGLHSLTSNVGRAGSMVKWVGSSLGARKYCTSRNELRCTRISLTCLITASLAASLLYFHDASLNFMHNLGSEEHMTLSECRYFLGDEPTILRTCFWTFRFHDFPNFFSNFLCCFWKRPCDRAYTSQSKYMSTRFENANPSRSPRNIGSQTPWSCISHSEQLS